MPNLYVISGCNGAGKTTASYTILPEMLNCKEFVNADEIAKGLSPFNPESVSIRAGKIMLGRMKELLESGVDFAFETTLATRSYIHLIKEAHEKGYQVTLLYFWLNSPELAIKRVKARVLAGGHDIDKEVIVRRYGRGIVNFFHLYSDISDFWLFIDNSNSPFEIIAEGSLTKINKIHDTLLFEKLKNYE